MVSRLGTENLTEPSEELRLSLICLLKSILQSYSARMGPYVNDVMLILQNTVVDPYPEVKKVSLCGFVCSTLILLYIRVYISLLAGKLSVRHLFGTCYSSSLLSAVQFLGETSASINGSPALQSQTCLSQGDLTWYMRACTVSSFAYVLGEYLGLRPVCSLKVVVLDLYIFIIFSTPP